MNEAKNKFAYINYRRFAVRYDLERHTFSYWFEPAGFFVTEARVEGVTSADENKKYSAEDFSPEASVSRSYYEGGASLSVTRGGGPEIQRNLTLSFFVGCDGIRFEAYFWGDMDVRVSGALEWGRDMENETFACRVSNAGAGLRSAYGPATSTADDALFDREEDRALEFYNFGSFRIKFDWENKRYRFVSSTGASDCERGFSVRVRENFFAGETGLEYRPLNKKMEISRPPCGWMSWYALQFNTNEESVLANARLAHELFGEFGANVVWVDWEWYHSSFGGIGREGINSLSPDGERYPNGLNRIADEINKLGMIPAIWIGATNEPALNRYIEKDPSIALARKPSWCGQYFYDPTNETYLREYIPEVFGNLKKWGYRAVKWDCIPITLETLDEFHDRMSDESVSSERALRNVIVAGREALGDEIYMLSCAGSTERDILVAADIFDAARIGGDIFKWGEFVSQCVGRAVKYYRFHNILFYNDADNVVVRPEYNTRDQAISRVSFVSMIGLPVTLGDDLRGLPDDRIELIKRGLPALDIRPADLCEPVSGAKILKMNLNIEREYESWNVVNILNLTEQEADASVDLQTDVHLERGTYLAYDFWSKSFVGECRNKFTVSLPPHGSKTLAVRRRTGFPQLLSTSRHISQGAVDLEFWKWDAPSRELRGLSNVIKNDPYEIVLYIPDGFVIENGGPLNWIKEGKICCAVYIPATTEKIEWKLKFKFEI